MIKTKFFKTNKIVASTALSAITASMFLGFAPNFASASSLPETVETQKGTAKVVATDKTQKIHWSKPFISIEQYNMTKLEDARSETGLDLNVDLEDGISADFMVIKQIKTGVIDTPFGEFSLVWHNTPEHNDSFMNVCKGDVCTSDVRLKAIDNKKGVLISNLKHILQDERELLGLNSGEDIAFASVRLKDVLSSRPNIRIVNKTFNDTKVHEIKFSTSEPVLNEETNRLERIGHWDNDNGKLVKILKDKNSNATMMSLEDGTRVYSRIAPSYGEGVVDLFYLDFNNEKSGEEITVVDLGLVKQNW